MHLGELLKLLRALKQDGRCYFIAPSRLSPSRITSYRGDYAQLSFEASEARKTIGEVVKMLEAAIGTTFVGYKGGDYVASENCQLYAAGYGDTGLQVTGIVLNYDDVYLQLAPYTL